MKSRDALNLIREIVGEKCYQELLIQLSGMTVYFPNEFEYIDKSVRNLSLREDFYTGNYEVTDLARKYNLSISYVYKILQNRV
jgi:Mor family transcriptional regulator